MTELEFLLRETFIDRERDLDGVAPSLLGRRDRVRRQRRQLAAVATGAAAVALVIVGTAAALTGGPPRAGQPQPGAGSTGPAPGPTASTTAPISWPPAYRAAAISSAAGRTGATLSWAPSWLPAGMAERGRSVDADEQTRSYGQGPPGPSIVVTTARSGCVAPQIPHERLATAVTVAGRPAQLWLVQFGGAGHLVCVPLRGTGSLRVMVINTADTTRDAIRVAASVRSGRRDEVTVPISLPAGHAVTTVGVYADESGAGQWQDEVTTADADISIGAPRAEGWTPNFTVAGRPALISTTGAKGAFLTFDPVTGLELTLAGDSRQRTIQVANGIQVGRVPDYGWLGRR